MIRLKRLVWLALVAFCWVFVGVQGAYAITDEELWATFDGAEVLNTCKDDVGMNDDGSWTMSATLTGQIWRTDNNREVLPYARSGFQWRITFGVGSEDDYWEDIPRQPVYGGWSALQRTGAMPNNSGYGCGSDCVEASASYTRDDLQVGQQAVICKELSFAASSHASATTYDTWVFSDYQERSNCCHVTAPVKSLYVEGYDYNTGDRLVQGDKKPAATGWGTLWTGTPKDVPNYEFMCWSSNGLTCTSYESQTSAYVTNENVVVYAFYARKKTLTAYAVDMADNMLNNSDAIASDRVFVGDAASVSHTGFNPPSGYTFMGWKVTSDCTKASKVGYITRTSGSDYVSGSQSPKEFYNIASISSNSTVCAVYRPPDVTLRGVGVTSKGKYLYNGIASNTATVFASDTVHYGDTARVTADHQEVGGDAYGFMGWKVPIGTCNSSGTKNKTFDYGRDTNPYEIFGLKNNMTVCAVYGQNTFTVESVDAAGSSLSTVYGLNDRSISIPYGGSGQIDHGDAEGYTFLGWKVNATDSSFEKDSSVKTYAVTNVIEDITRYAVYERNAFSGMASVAEGKNWSGTSNRASTGWWPSGSTTTGVSVDMDCPNAGCDANYWLSLRRDVGEGGTAYRTGVTKNDNVVDSDINWITAYGSWLAIIPNKAPSYSLLLGTSGNVGYNVQLKPGETECRCLTFYPYGAYKNNEYQKIYACAKAKATEFKGKSSVSGATSGTTDWQGSSKTETATIDNCSPTDGCKVRFDHRMKADPNNGGSTEYTISRTSNLTPGSVPGMGISNESSLKTGTFSGGDAEVYKSEELTLYPGMVVCETVKFKPSNDVTKTINDVSVTACASALGNAQPPDPGDPDKPEDPNTDSGDTALINIKVRNDNVTKYNQYQRTVYAKPGDQLDFRATYNPRLQYTYYLKPQQMVINGTNKVYPSATTKNTGYTMGTMFNAAASAVSPKLQGWNSDIAVYSKQFFTYFQTYDYTNGSQDKQAEKNSHTVAVNEVGKELKEHNQLNEKYKNTDSVMTTPTQVTFTQQNGFNRGTVYKDSPMATAYARIPLNYINVPEVFPGDDDPDPIAPGEETGIPVEIETNPRPNPVTTNDPEGCANSCKEEYATKVPEAVAKLIVYYPDDGSGETERPGTDSWGSGKDANLCSFYGLQNDEVTCGYTTVSENETLNPSGNEKGAVAKKTASFVARDLPAGSKICFALAVYPANSGAYTNLESSGSNSWSISASKCSVIGKKPSLQVWGGNIYSTGKITTAVSAKNNVAGVTETYSVGTANEYNYVFGSWGELGLISNGKVSGMASGAGTGYAANYGGLNGERPNVWPAATPSNGLGNTGGNPGGSYEKSVSLCLRSTLTFANYPCNGGTKATTGNLGASTLKYAMQSDRFAILEKYMSEGEGNIDGSDVVLNNDAVLEKGVYYYHGKSGAALSLGSTELARGTVQIVHSEKDVNIVGNLQYPAGGYEKLEDVPKLIIYAKENIYIDCKVTRIDAMLIAGNDVVTCASKNAEGKYAEDTNVNSEDHSIQLTINGSVITKHLTANRTYGASTGANSIVSAEIIDYDVTLYQWGGHKADTNNSSRITATYTRELSPRW